MTKLAFVLAGALMLASASVGIAGEGSPDFAVPAKGEHYGSRAVAAGAAGTLMPDRNATVPTFDAAERARFERASRAYDG